MAAATQSPVDARRQHTRAVGHDEVARTERFSRRQPSLQVYLDDVRQEPEGWVRAYTAGETIELLKASVRALTQLFDYDVPQQDLTIPRSHLPPRPESGFVIRNVQPLGGRRQRADRPARRKARLR